MDENKVEEAQVGEQIVDRVGPGDVVAKSDNPIIEAKRLIEEDKTTRMQQALAEINDILKKYNCELSAVTQLNAK